MSAVAYTITTCKGCRWFSPHRTDAQAGTCHVDPPRSQGVLIGEKRDPPRELMWLWPTVTPWNFCPKWEQVR